MVQSDLRAWVLLNARFKLGFAKVQLVPDLLNRHPRRYHTLNALKKVLHKHSRRKVSGPSLAASEIQTINPATILLSLCHSRKNCVRSYPSVIPQSMFELNDCPASNVSSSTSRQK